MECKLFSLLTGKMVQWDECLMLIISDMEGHYKCALTDAR